MSDFITRLFQHNAKTFRQQAAKHDAAARAAERDGDKEDAAKHREKARQQRRAARRCEHPEAADQ